MVMFRIFEFVTDRIRQKLGLSRTSCRQFCLYFMTTVTGPPGFQLPCKQYLDMDTTKLIQQTWKLY